MGVADKIRHYLEERLPSNHKGTQLTDNTLLLEQKIIDSIGMLEMVFFIQETFGLEVPDEDISPDHFDTINHLAAYIESRTPDAVH
ncbi:MAG: acyl carrier protein [Anaerolineae bacterium]|jgi:acyl carrier protein|nr:acyl carrier protein [Anaerolineae bacterium]